MSKLPMWIIAIIVLNLAVVFIFFNNPRITPENPVNITENISQVPTENITEPFNLTENITNISFVYENNCKESIENYVKIIENISNISIARVDAFNTTVNVTYYLQHNWSSDFYDIVGMKKDVTDNITVVTVINLTTNKKREFNGIPILCDENGKIGSYSSCILSSVPIIPEACYKFTVNTTECEIELREYELFDDIEYWVNPPGASISISSAGLENKTDETFNFTILSSRKRLESFGISIIQRTFSPLNDDEIFSSTKITNGEGGSIVRLVNLTNRTSVEFYATIWFKKKCYDKYVIY